METSAAPFGTPQLFLTDWNRALRDGTRSRSDDVAY